MKILALNCGSASVKFQLVETAPERMLGGGLLENAGSYEEAVHTAIGRLPVERREIDAVGHRIVHGGDRFSAPVALDDATALQIEAFSELAPLHTPPNLAGYRAAKAALPHCPHVGVFDTAFHQTLDPHAYLYALPYELCARIGLRRYGFHGTSHRYVAFRFAQLRGGKPEDFKVVTCHLGNGCSVAAIDGGRSVDTSMGFTPLEGLAMGTRAGDVDAGAVLYLMEKTGLGIAETRTLLNQQSGLLGLSGLTNDMRTLLDASGRGNRRAQLAIDVFCHRVKKYIGAFVAVLGGADAVIFTGGIGENAAPVREQICRSLAALGIAIDTAGNQAARGTEANITGAGARTEVWVIPTCEELLIARETQECLDRGYAAPA